MSVEHNDLLAICEKHGIAYERRLQWAGNTYAADCPDCAEERKARAQQEMQRRLDEARLQRDRQFRLRNCGVPVRYLPADIKTPLIKCEDSRRAFRTAYSFAKNLPENVGYIGRSLIMTGGVGTGKTHTGCAIINHALSKDLSAVYVRYTSILRHIKQTYNTDGGSEIQALERYTTPQVLVVDEIGTGYGTSWEERIFGDLIANRYDDLLPTVLISNLSLKEMEDELGTRVMSRMSDRGGVTLEFNWQSFRE